MAPGIRRRLLVIVASIVRIMLAFCFVFILFLDVKYFYDSVHFLFSHYWARCLYPIVL
jgi:succinate dehydrogenase hydrophobic anchor subunit